jgi:alpha-galactosidase
MAPAAFIDVAALDDNHLNGDPSMQRSLPAFLLLLACACAAGAAVRPPSNAPAQIRLDGASITIVYDGATIFKGRLANDPSTVSFKTSSEERGGAVTQVASFTSNDWNKPCVITGEITAGSSSFACEADRDPRRIGVVRHAAGPSRSLLNRAVYDRSGDWLLSADFFCRALVAPVRAGDTVNAYSLECRGREVILRFRPRYYQKHRGLAYYEPWTYDVWRPPVVGWCSWFAFFADVTEKDVMATADAIADKLRPFGYEYLQIDDGYQRGQGLPELWLNTNEKFPGGLQRLAEYIRGKGLRPGLWTNVAFNQHDFADRHRAWFVLGRDGTPAVGSWIDLSVDGSNSEAVDSLIRPVYRGLRGMGWEYFKVDALRHLRYEGYNSEPEYFRAKGLDRVAAYRGLVGAIRSEIGRDRFMLGCWGIRPELAGIIDGCRIGDDGFSFAGLTQYNSFNNVVWRNDPDHIELSEAEAYRSTMVTSLTGSVFMLTDKPEKYATPLVEPAKRAAPVLFTLPGQVFDVDPSRSDALARVDAEVSGSGPRPFDAGYTPSVHLFSLELDRPYEHWLLLGRTGGTYDRIAFADLGLAADSEYVVFEFWSKKLAGTFTKEFAPGAIDPKFNCQLFCIRRRLDRPQLVATSRHITCGAVDLERLSWDGRRMTGVSALVGGDPYDIYLTEPAGYAFAGLACDGARVVATELRGGLRVCRLLAPTGGTVEWKADFVRQ